MQVERNRNDRAIDRIQELQIGEKILEDVKLHEQEEQRLKQEKLDKNKRHKEELEKLIEQRSKIN